MTNEADHQDELRNRWLPLIKRQKTSGQSVAEFCRQHQVTYVLFRQLRLSKYFLA
jgi:hypothetical protein